MRALGFAAVVPLRHDAALAAFVALGAKRTGDVYTPTDVALLSLIGDRASAQLERFDHAELLREGRALADALSLEKDAALRASSEKTRFLATASHDLRQPVHALGLLIGALADLVRQPEHAALEPLVDQVAAAARSVDELVHGLLDLSRLDAGVLEPEREDVDLGRLLDAVERELEPVAAGKGLALRCVPTTLWGRSDPLLLRRIVQNLLANAVRYTETGRVLVGVRRSRATVRIEVHDTGPGFTPIQQERMFDEYQRFTAEQGGHSHPGLGLGLAIVQRLAVLLGHPLAARSIPSRGSCFTLELERVAAVRPTPAHPDAGAAFAGLRVLVVDDEPAVREAMRALLEGLGCRVSCASSTADALAGVRDGGFEPGVILADYWLGDGDTGLQTLQSVEAELGRAVPGLLISADASFELPEGCELLVLRKPVAPMRLRAAIRHVLRGSER
jgi:signal transduction histidine kinase